MIRCTRNHRTCSAYHRRLCEEYWAAREADEAALEQATALYESEVAEYKQQHRMITFKDWLTGSRQAVAAA